MAYNSNIDYKKEMDDYLSRGGKTTDSKYRDLEKSRNEKIAGASDSQLDKWGIDRSGNNRSSGGRSTRPTSNYTPYQPDDSDWFGKKYKDSIEGLARYNNVEDYSIARDMYEANLLRGGTYKGGGVVDYNIAKSDLERYLKDQKSYRDPGVEYPKTQDTSFEEYYKLLKGYQENQNQSILDALNSAFEQSKIGLEGQMPAIQQTAQQMRNQNDNAYFTQYLPQMRAALEQSGGYRGGDIALGTQGLLTARGQNLNQINQTESSQLQNLQNQLQQLGAQQGEALAEAQQGINEQTLNQLLTQLAAAQQQANWQAQFDQGKMQDAFNNAVTEAGLTGYYGGRQTMQGANNAAALQAQQLANEITKLQLNNLPQELNLQLQQLKQDLQKGNVSIAEANARIESTKQQIALDQQNQSQNALNNTISQIDSLYVYTDPISGEQKVNTNGLRAYIISLNLPDDQTDQLLRRYGVY